MVSSDSVVRPWFLSSTSFETMKHAFDSGIPYIALGPLAEYRETQGFELVSMFSVPQGSGYVLAWRRANDRRDGHIGDAVRAELSQVGTETSSSQSTEGLESGASKIGPAIVPLTSPEKTADSA